jgi:phenol 2-monooxygenase
MDLLAVTDFPDIRFKELNQSAHDGSMLVIPREGGYLVRLYVELTHLDAGERVANRHITSDDLIAKARRILSPYTLDVKEVAWWSVYEIGQRLTDKFDDVPAEEVATRLPRVFIAGDACHTHSAKAGQGMNVSMADAWNLGWKLAAVVRGRARPELLRTYSDERQAVARELIDFDREFSRLFRGRTTVVDPERFQRYFTAQGRFTAGVATRYAESMITGPATYQHLAEGFEIGTRFHSAPVVRVADAKPVQLGHVARADGVWRLYVFVGAEGRFPALERIADAVDVRGIFQQAHRDLTVADLPPVLLPRTGRLGLIDYEKAFCADPASDIFSARGIDRGGCLVLARPDQYVAHVLPVHRVEELAQFLAGAVLTG